jgi:helix-turn-helix protein
MSPQCQSLIDYLTRHGSITPNEALSALGIGRLSARVLDLKREGFGIATEIVEVPTRFGTAKVARYSIGTDGDRTHSQSGVLREQPPSVF